MSTDKPNNSPESKEKDQPPTNEPRSLLSEGILIAAASACAYFFAFLYEEGYSSFFNIPTQFISISLVNLLIFAAFAYVFIIVMLHLIETASFFLTDLNPYLSFHLPRYLLMLLLLGLIPLYLVPFSAWEYWLPTLIGQLIIGYLYLVRPLIRHRKAGAISQRYKAEIQHEEERERPPTFYDYLSRQLGRNFLFFIFLLITCFWLTHIAGIGAAMRQQNFLVTNTSPEMVVLRIYGDNMICAPFDRSTKEVQRNFSIIKVASDSAPVLSLQRIGPLRPAQLSTEPLPVPQPSARITPSETPISSPP